MTTSPSTTLGAKKLSVGHANTHLFAVADLFARVGLSLLFLLAGVNKLQQYEGTAEYMSAMGVPSALLPLVIAFELLAPLMLILGYWTRVAAASLAGFTLLTAVLFHADFADQMQFLMFFKNVAIAGGLLAITAHGAGRWSLDRRFTTAQQ